MSNKKLKGQFFESISDRFINVVSKRLSENKQVRRALPIWGRIHIDRQLPFLCVYRRPIDFEDKGTEKLITTGASYIVASSDKKFQPGLSKLISSIAKTLSDQFGAFLILEIRSSKDIQNDEPVTLSSMNPEFKILAPKNSEETSFLEKFQENLSRVKVYRKSFQVDIVKFGSGPFHRLLPVLNRIDCEQIKCNYFGLEVSPVYRDPKTGEVFTLILRELRKNLTRALHSTFFEFSKTKTTHRPAHYHALGRRATVKAVWETDRLLAEVSESFDFLLQLTPVNAQTAWEKFKRFKYNKKPVFHYRPTIIDPLMLKRKLYKAPVERVEDAALTHIFREKLDELDRQITLLKDRNTSRFILESSQLYGTLEDDLVDLAVKLLKDIPPRSRDGSVKNLLNAENFALKAKDEISYYRSLLPGITAGVDIRNDLVNLMVSRGSLLINSNLRIPQSRLEALIQHEVGTHVLTYHNGKSQRLKLLSTGLAGYDSLQEGLAVLAEYLVGGLSRPRLRLLAARVVAARCMLDGADFIETFRKLTNKYRISYLTAFNITMRSFRGGGLTKDTVYLQGLCEILQYIADKGELEPLFVGKIGLQHVAIMRELMYRGVLKTPPLKPRYLDKPNVKIRLAKLKSGMTVLDLIEGRKA